MKKYFYKLLFCSCVCVCVCVISCDMEEKDQFGIESEEVSNKVLITVKDFSERALLHGSSTGSTNRSQEFYTISEGNHYLNHGLNFTYCRPTNDFAEFKMIQDSFNLPVNSSNEIAEEDILDLYNEIAIMAGDYFYQDTNTYKEPFNFEVRIGSGSQTSSVPVRAIFSMGVRTCSALNSYPYASTDQWEIYPEAGNCYFQSQGNDALDHWRCDLNANLSYGGTLAHYYTNRYSVCFDPGESGCEGYEINYLPSNLYIQGSDLLNPDDITQWDNLYDYLIFRNSDYLPNYHTCAEQSEMDFHYEEMADLSIDYKPSSKVTGRHEVGFNGLFGQTQTTIFAVMRVDYFTRTYIQPEENFKLALPCTDC